MKRAKEKGRKGQRAKPPTSTWAIERTHWGRRTERKTEERRKGKKQRASPQPNYPGSFGCLLRATWILRWAILKHILKLYYDPFPPNFEPLEQNHLNVGGTGIKTSSF